MSPANASFIHCSVPREKLVLKTGFKLMLIKTNKMSGNAKKKPQIKDRIKRIARRKLQDKKKKKAQGTNPTK